MLKNYDNFFVISPSVWKKCSFSEKSISAFIDENSFNQRQNLWWDSFFTWSEKKLGGTDEENFRFIGLHLISDNLLFL